MLKSKLVQATSIVLAIAVPATVVAQQLYTFQDGEVLSAQKLNRVLETAAGAASDAADALDAVERLRDESDTAVALTVRVETANCSSSDFLTDCTCAGNEVAVGGGACTGNACALAPGAVGTALVESLNLASIGESARSWRVSCESTVNGARVACGTPHAVCLRVAP
jgi:hypothetical protein